jgi:hypothetical protein
MSDIPNPFNGLVDDAAIVTWLEQFEPDEYGIIETLLKHFRFYGPAGVNSALRTLHARVMQVVKRPLSNVWFIPVGYVAKSGSAIAYFYKTQNDIPQERFILSTDLEKIRLSEQDAVVFLDDYIGSGHQGRQVWDTVLSINPAGPSTCPFVFAAIVGTEAGLTHLHATTQFDVCTVDVLREDARPLAEASKIFPDPMVREYARSVLNKYGERLYPNAPLGYANSQGILGFFYSTPNNTLPIFWSTLDGWKPLLPHKESYRDPAFLAGPPSGLPKEVAARGGEGVLKGIAKLEEYDIPTDEAMRLLDEFRRLDILLSLVPAIKALGIGGQGLAALLRVAAKMRHLRHEREGVCASLLIVPDTVPRDSIGSLFVSATEGLHLSNEKEVLSLSQLIDGFDGAVVAKASGSVLGDTTFRKTSNTSYPLLPERYHRAARASLDTRGLLFLFSGDDRATVFYSGKRLLGYRGASWHLQLPDLEQGIRQFARLNAVDPNALLHVFRLALRLSDEGHGALITIGDHEAVLRLSDKPKTGHFTWSNLHLRSSDSDAVIGLMRQDGATIISDEGAIIQGMTFLRPPAGAPGVEEVGKGSKHSTAAKISGATGCIAVAVSVDGQITVFTKGEVLLKLMG